MKSKLYSLPAVTRTMRIGLVEVKKKSKTKPYWSGVNSYQKKLIDFFNQPEVKSCEDSLSSTELTTKVKVSGDILLKTLLAVDVKWLKKGEEAKAGSYRGVKLTEGFTVLDSNTVVLETKSGDRFFFCKKVAVESNAMNMLTTIYRLNSLYLTSDKKQTGYAGVIFPRVDLSTETNMKPVLGMRVEPTDFFVGECSQTIDFLMDTVGAKVKVQVVMRLTKSAAKPKYFTIAGPFTMWAVKPNQTVPYFCGIVGTDAFSK